MRKSISTVFGSKTFNVPQILLYIVGRFVRYIIKWKQSGGCLQVNRINAYVVRNTIIFRFCLNINADT